MSALSTLFDLACRELLDSEPDNRFILEQLALNALPKHKIYKLRMVIQ